MAWPAKAVCILVLPLLLLTASASARTDGAGAAAKACKKSERRAVLTKKRGKLVVSQRGRGEVLCLKNPPADPVAGAITALKRPLAGLTGKRARFNKKLRAKRTKLENSRLGALKDTYETLQSLGPPARAAQAGGRSVQTLPPVQKDGPGGETISRGTKTRPAPNESGSGFYAEVETIKRDGKKVSRGIGGLGGDIFVSECPDAKGLVAGTTKVKLDKTSIDESGGLRQIVTNRILAEVKVSAKVGDDARIRTFDFQGVATAVQEVRVERISDGKVVSRDPTTTVVAPIDGQDVDPRDPENDAASDAAFGRAIDGARGPSRGIDIGVALLREWGNLDLMVRTWTSQELLSAEYRWYEGFACASIDAQPSPTPLKRGGSATIPVKVTAADGSEITGPKLEASLPSAEGELSPASESPATLTFSDPRSEWDGTVHIEFLHTSKRGRAKKAMELDVEKGQDWKVEFEGTVTATANEYGEAFQSKSWRELTASGFWKLSADRVRIAPGEKTQVPDPCEFGGGTCEMGYSLAYHRKVDYDTEEAGDDEDTTCNTGGVTQPTQKHTGGVNAMPFADYVEVRALFPMAGFVIPCTGTDSEREWLMTETWTPGCFEPPTEADEIYNIQKIPNADLLNKDVIEFDLGRGPYTSSCRGGPWTFKWSGKARFTRL